MLHMTYFVFLYWFIHYLYSTYLCILLLYMANVLSGFIFFNLVPICCHTAITTLCVLLSFITSASGSCSWMSSSLEFYKNNLLCFLLECFQDFSVVPLVIWSSVCIWYEVIISCYTLPTYPGWIPILPIPLLKVSAFHTILWHICTISRLSTLSHWCMCLFLYCIMLS